MQIPVKHTCTILHPGLHQSKADRCRRKIESSLGTQWSQQAKICMSRCSRIFSLRMYSEAGVDQTPCLLVASARMLLTFPIQVHSLNLCESGTEPNVSFFFLQSWGWHLQDGCREHFSRHVARGTPSKDGKGKASRMKVVAICGDHIRSVSLHSFAPEDCPNLDALYSVGLPKWTWAFIMSMSIGWSQDFTKRRYWWLLSVRPVGGWNKIHMKLLFTWKQNS